MDIFVLFFLEWTISLENSRNPETFLWLLGLLAWFEQSFVNVLNEGESLCWNVLSVDLESVLLSISHDCENLKRRMSWKLDFEEWMVMGGGSLAFFTKVKVSTDCTFVPDSFNVFYSALIT